MPEFLSYNKRRYVTHYTIKLTLEIRAIVVCVCVFSSHSFWTSSSLDVPAGVTQEEGHTASNFFLRCVP